MRGIPRPSPARCSKPRISPAHAGNTPSRLVRLGHLRDQPRTCGEYRGAGWRAPAGRGSAPHMRGILKTGVSPRVTPGISPAHAGNTDDSYGHSRADRDQPRTCGEYLAEVCWLPGAEGSAPHMRGIQRGGFVPCRGGDQPRTCGEYSADFRFRGGAEGSAPHMRGIPAGNCYLVVDGGISPAHAGNTGCAGVGRGGWGDQPRTCGEYTS